MVHLQRIDTLNLVLDTPKGRGVFAAQRIPAGTVIDTAPVIILSDIHFTKHIMHTSLLHYSYNWPILCPSNPKTTVLRQAIVLGLGSMFNHSSLRQNVGWKRNLREQVVVYTALKDIELGQELLISYGPHLTFVDADAKEASATRVEESVEDVLGRIALDL